MKLLTKTTVYFLLIMLPIFAGGAFYLFGKFSKEIKHETDEELVNDKLQWLRYLDTAGINSPIFTLSTLEFNLTPTDLPVQSRHKLSGVTLYQETEDSESPFRQLSQVISIHGKNYQMVLRKSMIEKDDLIKNVIQVMLFAFSGLLFFVLLSNWFISKKIWKPFYSSLDKIQRLQLNKLEAVTFEHTDTHEFNQLNAALNNMTNRVHTDYTNMKELTEDAAHEMQTPLAIAQSKLELLLQDDTLSEEQLKAILLSYDELQRLSRLNHNLLLLAKIENQQYPVTEQPDLHTMVEKYLLLFEELIREKQLTIQKEMVDTAPWPLHPALTDIMVSNLLGNAIKYNYLHGTINIRLTTNSFSISNTSQIHEIPADMLFQRFKKQSNGYTNSNGLGLAIIKKIADSYQLTLTYGYENGWHTFTMNTGL
ncbi:signal transduction histidine kinase [Chitinophaga niastensis]|uniref:histidine kinase n=1 Tax=Chitinophaga niastensis TaxID=536980 RepID=A0A2P8HJM1_CHINA|nr:HAMP domain-containing sensor histidine kinase [Chitinophaga niastensis]PSL46414.1 signal transduction histidine kinase [Chitinophaga niastensis]